ncbi:Glyoxalase [Frankia sp. AiPs1]|uniref:VOC family protein n=1 Tax=Frankia sp. AiPa1 TaxID=573492 RepID=UPI00202AC557|nr:VOC family protein [Frankia sp. AiPa1]MCL9760989.1 VOC family protein [Frankia sp. AiPa1]
MDDITFTSSLAYREPKAALAWLTKAFGFDVTMQIEGPPDAPEMCHYEMSCAGRGRIMIGGEWTARMRSPASIGGVNSQRVHVQLPGGLDEHCARARAAGAVIDAEPADQFYGDRTYRVLDLEGHLWTFSTHIRDVSRAEAEEAIGRPIAAADWA